MAKKSSTEKEIEKSTENNKKDKSASNKPTERTQVEEVKKFVKDSFSELKKIQWPTRKQVTAETVVVIITVVFLTTLVTVFDSILSWAFSLIFAK